MINKVERELANSTPRLAEYVEGHHHSRASQSMNEGCQEGDCGGAIERAPSVPNQQDKRQQAWPFVSSNRGHRRYIRTRATLESGVTGPLGQANDSGRASPRTVSVQIGRFGPPRRLPVDGKRLKMRERRVEKIACRAERRRGGRVRQLDRDEFRNTQGQGWRPKIRRTTASVRRWISNRSMNYWPRLGSIWLQ